MRFWSQCPSVNDMTLFMLLKIPSRLSLYKESKVRKYLNDRSFNIHHTEIFRLFVVTNENQQLLFLLSPQIVWYSSIYQHAESCIGLNKGHKTIKLRSSTLVTTNSRLWFLLKEHSDQTHEIPEILGAGFQKYLLKRLNILLVPSPSYPLFRSRYTSVER